MTEVIFNMVYGKTCKACNETKPLIKNLEEKYQGIVRFRYWHIGDEKIDRFFNQNCGIDIETDETMDEEEKENYRRQGVDKYHALPTFFTILNDRPSVILDLMSGGVFYDSEYKHKTKMMEELENMITKALIIANNKPTAYRMYSKDMPTDLYNTEYMLEKYQER